ncbi:MAG: DUF3891 family protein [Pirellulales bacterium]
MIRRKITVEDGTANWLLISQVEHARVSGEITRAWQLPFPQEAIDGITHHDDGWAEWEAAPRIDRERGRPTSFLELPIAEALGIWNRSIESAHQIGELAGAIVAGHFLGLAGGSDQADNPLVTHWSRGWTLFREGWIAQWKNQEAGNTQAVFDQAQQMQLAADLLSLWLCMDGPISSGGDEARPNSEMQSRSATVLGKYRFETKSQTLTPRGLDWSGSLTPWPFAREAVEFAAPAMAVPVGNYADWPSILAVSRPFALRWRLRQTLPAPDEC